MKIDVSDIYPLDSGLVFAQGGLAWMTLDFAFPFARRAPIWATAMLGIIFELVALWAIQSNLILNVVMLVRPVEAIKVWQGGL